MATQPYRALKPEFGIRTSLNRCFLSASSLFRHLKSRRSSATPATLNALRLEANKNQQFSFVLNPNSGLKHSELKWVYNHKRIMNKQKILIVIFKKWLF
jgi:hypothetical protein